MNTPTARYWQAYFILKIRVWVYFARIVDRWLSEVTVQWMGANESPITRVDIDAIIAFTEFDYISYGTKGSQLMYDVNEINSILFTTYPFSRYTAWYRAIVAKRQAQVSHARVA